MNSNKYKTKQMYIKPGTVAYKVLQWMQEHPISLKKTTAHHIASRVAALPDVENGELTVEQQFGNMVKCNVIYREKHEHSHLSDFRINYWHKSIPADILADAPADVKRAMVKTIDDMKSDQYMDDEGCVVTPNAVEKTEDPFNEDGETPTVEKSVEKMEKDYGVTVADTASVIEQPTTQNVTVPLDIKKDGKQITVNLSLTINL